ncbi:uncharacterized protein LOC133795601 [Humulus lupulus]|uniref:uncharacterized protein LOC133795601 n=1 Tax=Humulus lupulus TaxID=3486 RepID=UPI002B402FA8|nr:uncharacterized protein LOC133795601 [Humulus lupulus]
MASSSAHRDIEEEFGGIMLEDEEMGGLSLAAEEEDEGFDVRWCLVGRFLNAGVIDTQEMQHMMAFLWKPGKGLYVKELGKNLFLFQFYHEIDIQRVIAGSPWTFERKQLIFHRLREGDNPRSVCLNKLDLWVQLFDLQHGFRSQSVVQSIGNYVGRFVDSDINNFSRVWREFLRVRVTVDIDQPLKRRMKISRKDNNEWFWVNFKYEQVPTFCFICGIIGHSERFCPKLFDTPLEDIEKPYGVFMRVAPRRQKNLIGAQWLRSGKVEQTSHGAGRDAAGEAATPTGAGTRPTPRHADSSSPIPETNLGRTSRDSAVTGARSVEEDPGGVQGRSGADFSGEAGTVSGVNLGRENRALMKEGG